jgi:hypothetical protein
MRLVGLKVLPSVRLRRVRGFSDTARDKAASLMGLMGLYAND